MATATIEYNLDDREDSKAFSRAVKSTELANALFEIKYNVRDSVQWELSENGNVVTWRHT